MGLVWCKDVRVCGGAGRVVVVRAVCACVWVCKWVFSVLLLFAKLVFQYASCWFCYWLVPQCTG